MHCFGRFKVRIIIQHPQQGSVQGDELHQLLERLDVLRKSIVVGLPECLSRLEFAAEPLFAEISRGYFLPFCTVAVGVISRIRTLLLRLGRYALQYSRFVELEKQLEQIMDSSKNRKSGVLIEQRQSQWGPGTDVFERARNVFFSTKSFGTVYHLPSKNHRVEAMLQSLGLSIPRSTRGSETIGSELAGGGDDDDVALEMVKDTGNDTPLDDVDVASFPSLDVGVSLQEETAEVEMPSETSNVEISMETFGFSSHTWKEKKKKRTLIKTARPCIV